MPSGRDLLRQRWTFALLVVLALLAVAPAKADSSASLSEQTRRPVTILPMANESQLAILNRRSGTLSVVDPRARAVLHEHAVAKQIAAGCVLTDDLFVVLDDRANELRVFEYDLSSGPRLLAHHAVAAAPVCVTVSPDRDVCVVASTWARRLSVFSLSPTEPACLQLMHTFDLAFAPRQLRFLDEQRLLVADAFGGWIAVVDVQEPRLIRSRELNATHNITGLALGSDGATVYLTHQMLNDEQATTQPNVHWGDVMSNVVRQFALRWFLSDEPEQTTAADLYYLGYPDRAAGDPSGILTTESERFLIGFGGVNQVAVSDRGLNHFQRLDVGRRPVAMWIDQKHQELFVANQLDDTVTVIDLRRTRVTSTVSLGPSGPLSLADKGEQLFYDASLSSDGWYSCHSCHSDGHTNGRQSDTFGDGYGGDAKQVLSLLGTAETAPWAWNGQMPMLEAQVRKSIETTMQGDSPTTEQVQALAAFLMTLSPPPSIRDARREPESAGTERGRVIFQDLGCIDCHQPPKYTSTELYDVGLEDAKGRREFNPPSLLGVGHRRRLLHDGRAEDLRAVLQVHPSNAGIDLEPNRGADLEAFLLSL